jgi:hypothetical protein
VILSALILFPPQQFLLWIQSTSWRHWRQPFVTTKSRSFCSLFSPLSIIHFVPACRETATPKWAFHPLEVESHPSPPSILWFFFFFFSIPLYSPWSSFQLYYLKWETRIISQNTAVSFRDLWSFSHSVLLLLSFLMPFRTTLEVSLPSPFLSFLLNCDGNFLTFFLLRDVGIHF